MRSLFRRAELLWVVGTVGLFLLAGLLFFQRNGRVPVFQGRSVDAWALQTSSPDPQAREQASLALRALGSNAVPRLITLLRAKDSMLSSRFWPRAGKLPFSLREMLRHHVPPPSAMSMRGAAARGLGILGDAAAPAVPALMRVLHDPVDEVRWNAATALGRIGKAAVPALSEALGDQDYRVRHAAAYALGEAGAQAEPAIPALMRALADPAPTVNDSAVGSLCRIGGAAVAPLIACVENGTGIARQNAADALLRLLPSPRRAAPALLRMAHDENADSRRKAIELLAGIHAGDPVTIAGLTEALGDPVPEVRLAAAQALAPLGAKASGSVARLAAALRDEAPSVREQAAKTLGELGPTATAAAPDLTTALGDRQEAVRAAATEALAKLESRRSVTKTNQ